MSAQTWPEIGAQGSQIGFEIGFLFLIQICKGSQSCYGLEWVAVYLSFLPILFLFSFLLQVILILRAKGHRSEPCRVAA